MISTHFFVATQNGAGVPGTFADVKTEWWLLVIAEALLLFVVLVVLPWLAQRRARRAGGAPLKGLNLPEGSVRSMLALATVGSLVVVAVFGGMLREELYDRAVTVLGTLAGPVLGFYFGSRGSQGPDSKPQPGA